MLCVSAGLQDHIFILILFVLLCEKISRFCILLSLLLNEGLDIAEELF